MSSINEYQKYSCSKPTKSNKECCRTCTSRNPNINCEFFNNGNNTNYRVMTQENKDLLLKDLCSRLPYGVKVHINSPIDEQNSMELFDVNLDSEHIGVGNEKWAFRAIPIVDGEDKAKVVKPYLRPMSSMTEEEKKEFESLGWRVDELDDNAPWNHNSYNVFDGVDWLNKKMFDYRGLIPMGLALEAKEGMYEKP